MGLKQVTTEYYDNSGGLDLASSPTKTLEEKSTYSYNVDYSIDGSVGTAKGSTVVNVTGSPQIPNPISGNPRILELFNFRKEDGTEEQIIVAGDSLYYDIETPTLGESGLTADTLPDFEQVETNSDQYVIFGNGVDDNLISSDGQTWNLLSIEQATAPTLTDFAVGTLAAGDYYYYVEYGVRSGGVLIKTGELSPISSVLTIAANRTIQVTIPVSSDPQVNARVIYRISPTSLGIAYRLTTITDNVTTTYNDSTPADGTIEAVYDNQAAPTSGVFENNDFGETLYVDAAQKNVMKYSKPYIPWAVPTENEVIFDGEIKCLKRIFGITIVGTDKSIWVISGALFDGAEPRRVSSKIGILNNRCAVGLAALYILATDLKVYRFFPTDFSQSEIRITEPISRDVFPVLAQITNTNYADIKMEYFIKADQAKVFISAPTGGDENKFFFIFNERQSQAKGYPVWQFRNNIRASALLQMTVNNADNLYAGDYYGLIWKLEVENQYGDGSEENGSVSSATATTLTDSTASWTVNEHIGKTVRIISGEAVDVEGFITANTATELTVDATWDTTPVAGDEYTIGGYDAIHFTNWKSVNGSYDDLKQLCDFFSNLNTAAGSGSYPITVIFQFDFDTSTANQEEIAVNLSSTNTIWGVFVWGAALWGARSVFQDRKRKFGRFRAIRIGIQNRKAGQPWQLNGLSLTTTNRSKLYRKAA